MVHNHNLGFHTECCITYHISVRDIPQNMTDESIVNLIMNLFALWKYVYIPLSLVDFSIEDKIQII